MKHTTKNPNATPRKRASKKTSANVNANGTGNTPGNALATATPTPFSILDAFSVTPPTVAELKSTALEAVRALEPLETTVASLTQITSHAEYKDVDAVFGEIVDLDKTVDIGFDPVVRKLREPLDIIYELRRGLVTRITAMKKTVAGHMAGFQNREKDRLRLEQEENDRRTRELQAKQESNALPIKGHPGPGLGDIIPGPGFNLVPFSGAGSFPALRLTPTTPSPSPTTIPTTTYVPPPSAPLPRAIHSSARYVTKYRVSSTDMLMESAFLGMGGVPFDIITVNQGKLDEYFKLREVNGFAQWPGIEVYEDTSIAGR